MSFDDEVGRLEAAAGRFVGVTLRCRRLRDVHGGSAVWFARPAGPSSTEA
jgi:hypothetical protein